MRICPFKAHLPISVFEDNSFTVRTPIAVVDDDYCKSSAKVNGVVNGCIYWKDGCTVTTSSPEEYLELIKNQVRNLLRQGKTMNKNSHLELD